ncbi:hypothetical protein EV193_10396 [Herbihabitans rhizosphaerae]|uniref:DUF6973 domain-containing protein n=1 Tax=Herbihabitans rhizosphaerae TaxID=1872711 RepID=A0A4V2ETE4_9PSEU|nr:hypothetical protein [Herbihabitans rhizosphaerae]RZS40783.1 hypothetical protein EV193_10396 [Herbihabitans rhizosphaerae]
MVSFADVRRWDAAHLEDAEIALKSRGEQLLGFADEIQISGGAVTWIGPAADGAKGRRDVVADKIEHLVAETTAAKAAVGTAGDAVARLKQSVDLADSIAAKYQMVITNDGTVYDPYLLKQIDMGQQLIRQSVRKNLQDHAKNVIEQAERIDEGLAGVLGKIAQGKITDGGATDLGAAAAAGERQGSLHDQLLSQFPPPKIGKFVDLPFTDKKLTEEEWKLLRTRPWDIPEAKENEETATSAGKEVYKEETPGDKGDVDGHRDAFRHAYWNALNTNSFGQDFAEKIGTAHETSPIDPNAEPHLRPSDVGIAMDLHNNEVGRQIAAEHPGASQDQLKQYVHQAVQDGRMVVVNQEGRLVPSNQVEVGQTGYSGGGPRSPGK